MTRLAIWAALALTTAAVLAPSSGARGPTCADYPDQAAAQRAADTRDADGDGIYCESLPCPCAKPGGSSKPPTSKRPARGCSKPRGVQEVSFSKTKYRNIRAHYRRAVTDGWPRILVLNRRGADARRDRLLEEFETRAGFDRDEYPPAVGRGRGSRALERGVDPLGWRASVEYVPSSENRSHGSRLGAKLRRFCNGTKFKYVFY